MENKYQEKFGYPAQRTAGKVRPYMAEWIQDFIRHSPFCVMATSNAGGDCDASPKGGRPGFVKILNDKQLFLPEWRETSCSTATAIWQAIQGSG